jgi:hypothetical protein
MDVYTQAVAQPNMPYKLQCCPKFFPITMSEDEENGRINPGPTAPNEFFRSL